MSNGPLVAAVIVHWGPREVTMECIKSLKSGFSGNLTIIIVDNCPQERLWRNPLEVEHSVIYICSATNTGYSGGNNAGIVRAQSLCPKYILVINNDSVVDDKLLTECVSYMESHHDIAVLSPKILFYQWPLIINSAGGKIDISGEVILFGLGQEDSPAYSQEKDLQFVHGCAFFARANIFDQIGMFDEDLFCYGEDVDLSCRLVRAGMTIRYFPRAKVWHRHLIGRINGKSIPPNTVNAYYDWRNKLHNLRRHFAKNQPKSCATFARNFLWAATLYVVKHRRPELCRAMFLGVSDCLAGRMGKRNHPLFRQESST